MSSRISRTIANCRALLAAALAVFLSLPAPAHNVTQIPALLTVDEDRWTAVVSLDSAFVVDVLLREIVPEPADLAWIQGMTAEEHAAIRAAAEGFLREVFQIGIGDGDALPMEVRFPDFDQTPLTFAIDQAGTPILEIVLEGTFPDLDGDLSIRWYAEDAPDLVVSLRIGPQDERPELFTIPSGQTLDLARRKPDGETTKTKAKTSSFLTWLRYGFEHILPKGLDHILFILGLFLLAPRWKPLLAQSLTFTVAHSVTLALVVLGIFSVSSRVVEPLIALSIAWIGIENLFLKELKPWRLILVFALGLLHGMGFASVMQELPVPKNQVLEPLIGFNLGVEFGQIAVLALAFTATAWFLRKPESRDKVRIGGSAVIAAVGIYWTVERVLGG